MAIYVGELGWELFCFQGILRRMAKNYDRVIVASRRGHDLLYSDFFYIFVSLDNVGSYTSGPRCLDYKYNNLHKQYVGKDADVIGPNKALARYDNPSKWRTIPQHFISYGRSLDTYITFLIHARMKTRSGSNYRNWDIEKWELLVNRLKAEYPNVVIGAIGTSDAAYCPHKAIDLRDISLRYLADYMNSVQFVLGPSSGPMHFATLCNCPQIVWSDESNRVRYKTDWNPFQVPVDFISEGGWNPDIDTIYNRVIRYLDYDTS